MNEKVGTESKSASWTGPALLLTATAAAGLWLWQTHGAYVRLGPAVSLVVLAAALGVFWLLRVRAARRFLAALDAYAEKELARAEHRPHPVSLTRN